MKPIVDGLQADYGDRVAFLQLDAQNEGREAFAAFKLRGHPSYVIIDVDGQVLWQNVGEQPGGRLEAAIQDALRGE
jgi:hypothetical protein